ncbi:hypothetical protein DXX93_08760 [Thalassotalea euphylliae]|uniref:Transmembrane protein n=1 Tax=Thalassotalea euphylliae TaxID=1655234 RepID=A0A3E0TRQ4_9GAMM|nr:hypothetical protein [Thalassotalea euphylliae]REL26662.1 hypothetical protein DXX93_08760 [Thalassotalea euphylliae]
MTNPDNNQTTDNEQLLPENEPKGEKIMLSDGSHFYYNETKEERDRHLEERLRKWREENPEEAAATALRVDNQFKYIDAGVYYQQPPTDYLHRQSYAQRLARAEALNGCKFRDSPPYKSKAWGEPMDRVLHEKRDSFRSRCDGKIAIMGRLNGFVTYSYIIQWFSFWLGLMYIIAGLTTGNIIGYWPLSGIATLLFIAMIYVRRFLEPFDQFIFNRHTGLVRTPHNWWRRSFYIPYEDIECYHGGVVKSARGGGARESAKFRCMKTPKRFYLKTPEFIARFGGISQGQWAGYLAFMDTSIPVNENLHESIEYYYTLGKNALETGPFPEEIKPYLDPDDKQVNREHVW